MEPKGLLDMLREGGDSHLALTPDGPRGPRRRVQAGVVLLASCTGLPLVPVGVGYTHAWRGAELGSVCRSLSVHHGGRRTR